MTNVKPTSRRISRRDFLALSSKGIFAGLVAVSTPAAAGVVAGGLGAGATGASSLIPAYQAAVKRYMRLVATDGFIALPGRSEPLYVFGFREVLQSDLLSASPVPATAIAAPIDDLDIYKGKVQNPAPIIAVDQGDELYLTLTNIGLVGRPDLDDSHTIHWHGFRNPVALFDGVPEVSIAVPVGRDFRYFYRAGPVDPAPGTYIYHCHFEDSEHVQMGMTGVVFIRPTQNFTGAAGGPAARLGGNAGSSVMGYAYNDGVAPGDGASTAYDREFTLLLNEIDTRPHDGLLAVQEFVWSDYKPNYWVINGRSYPYTIEPNADPNDEGNPLHSQPISSLIQCNAGDRVLLRFANLGYQQHALVAPGIRLRVIGEDATVLRNSSGANLSYYTNTLFIGPGEARDVMFVAPAKVGSGTYDTYYLKNRSYFKQTNNGQTGLGGMVTEIRVYPSGYQPNQTRPNETYS